MCCGSTTIKFIFYTFLHLVGDDYLEINDTITFEADELEKSVLLILVDNSAVEEVENLQVTITPIPGLFPVAVKNNTAVVVITDNDSKLVHCLIVYVNYSYSKKE